ncbi:aquaporin Z [Vibrio mediterranei AK1]|nr:aquaporin Z [Vibrio mediterranei AK1]
MCGDTNAKALANILELERIT